jgi:predicted nuclease of restriction endonuclease-like (RecB) superfamily
VAFQGAQGAAALQVPHLQRFVIRRGNGPLAVRRHRHAEEALIRRLEHFLLELGDDFAFMARQKRLRVGDDWYRVDLASSIVGFAAWF